MLGHLIPHTSYLNSERMNRNLLIIFTRNPELGKVKTRLAKDVGDENALTIYNILLRHTKKITENVNAVKQVWYSENIKETDLWSTGNYQKHLQLGNDLGARMQLAFQKGFQSGYQNIIVIGSDLYDIQTKDINEAFDALEKHGNVIGPAEDGGYYLLGLTEMIPELFENKPWGTDEVLQKTLQDLSSNNYELLEEKNDVDYWSDIEDIPIFQEVLKQHNNL